MRLHASLRKKKDHAVTLIDYVLIDVSGVFILCRSLLIQRRSFEILSLTYNNGTKNYEQLHIIQEQEQHFLLKPKYIKGHHDRSFFFYPSNKSTITFSTTKLLFNNKLFSIKFFSLLLLLNLSINICFCILLRKRPEGGGASGCGDFCKKLRCCCCGGKKN